MGNSNSSATSHLYQGKQMNKDQADKIVSVYNLLEWFRQDSCLNFISSSSNVAMFSVFTRQIRMFLGVNYHKIWIYSWSDSRWSLIRGMSSSARYQEAQSIGSISGIFTLRLCRSFHGSCGLPCASRHKHRPGNQPDMRELRGLVELSQLLSCAAMRLEGEWCCWTDFCCS